MTRSLDLYAPQAPDQLRFQVSNARALSIKRHTRPIRLVRPQVEDFIEIYRHRGFDQRELLQLA